ncbi:MAG TPA: hypothetical protein VIK54_08560, partial [Acidimicrobiia bacterium]
DLAKIESAVDRIAGVVNDVTSQRRGHVEELREAVRDEVQRQMSTLGLATKDNLVSLKRAIRDDLTALEDRLRTEITASTSGEEESARNEPLVRATSPQQRASYGEPPTD